MRLFAEMLPRHNTDLGDRVSVVDWQAFCEVLRQHWPRALVIDGEQRCDIFAPLDDADALRVYKGVFSGALRHEETGLTWLQLADRRARRTEKHS